ncbi:magnesium transporter MRS2-I-like isoform X2 [Coffea arabica]|uniref:Magnesium transporter n=1 Tax=Coffea arabica TaxID=13443 RepID=A0ABM4X1U8_COFAR
MGREGGYVVPVDPGTGTGGGLKKKGAGSRSWILMDSSGQETVLDVDKYAIMHRVQIHARDLRILDPLLSYPSAILGRDRAIVLNLEHIKAIITAEEVLLRDPLDDNVTPVVEELRRRLKSVNSNHENHEDGKELLAHNDVENGEEDGITCVSTLLVFFSLLEEVITTSDSYSKSPFEFRALEVALEAICSYLAARTIELETAVYPALDMLTSKISSRNLDRVRKLKSQMTRLTARVQKVRDELEQLLDDDDDMADLYLSRKLAGASSPVSGSGAAGWFLATPTIGSKISRASRASVATVRGDEDDVEELEMLLELREYIDNTEDYINIQLDNHRNQLIQLELFLSSGTVCMSIYSLIAGIFGMNIPYTWNDDHGYMFKWVVVFSGFLAALTFVLIISYARYKGLVG